MTKCPKCQFTSEANSVFCAQCGFDFRQNQPAAAAPPMQNKSNLKAVWIVLGVLFGSCVLCGIIGGINDQINPKKESSKTVSGTPNPTTIVNSSPVPIASITPPSLAELKPKADKLLAIKKEDYETTDLADFDAVMNPLKEIPKTSKDYNAAQSLHKKLLDKAAVIGAERIVMGPKPEQSSFDGDVEPVKTYLKTALNDYDSSEFVEWSPVAKVYIKNEPYWGVRLKLRAKNAFGAYILRDTYYFMRNNQVIKSQGLN